MLKHMATSGTAQTPIPTSCEHSASARFEALLARPEARLWIGEVQGTVVGFLSMIVGSMDPVERRLGGAEIPRIYVIEPAQRAGLGRLLLDAAIEQATTEGLSHVWLD